MAGVKSLKEAYKEYFDIGTVVEPLHLVTHDELIRTHFNCITAENALKQFVANPNEGKFHFDGADVTVAYAQKHGMKMRGHNLVWHYVLPDWLSKDAAGCRVSRDALIERMRAYIRTCMERYGDKIYCWDVLNEAVGNPGEEYLRKSLWLDVIGPDYISMAFHIAHEANPNALLCYNDYDTEIDDKREKVYRLVKSELAKGTPIHVVGIQGHCNLYEPEIDAFRRTIERFGELGLPLQITEIDMAFYQYHERREVYDNTPSPKLLDLQAKRYGEMFKIFREYKDLIASVSFWGMADDHTWHDHFPVERRSWPLLFDDNHEPKPAYYAIADF